LNSKKQQIFSVVSTQLVCTLLLIWPALYNGYPLLISDSAAYIASGHLGQVPVDRPIIYGLFLRHISLSWSTWLVIITQSIFINYLIYLITKYFIKSKKKAVLQLILISILAFGTSLAHYCSFLLADIFTPISLLSLFLLLILNQKKHLTILSFLFLLSTIVHLSHIPLIISVLALSIVFLWFFKRDYFKIKLKRIGLITSLFLAALLSITSINFSLGYGFKIARTTNIFLAARLIETGIANKHLKKNCSKKDFEVEYKNLCKYIDQFKQWPYAGIYLFDSTSPFYQGGCNDKGWENCWLSKDKAYGDLTADIMKDPALRKEFIYLIGEGTIDQLSSFELEPLNPQQHTELIEWHYKFDLKQFKESRQFNARQEFNGINTIERYLFYSSLFVLLLLGLKYWKQLTEEAHLFILIVLVGLISNAMLVSTLSTVVPRYQGRIAFLIPLVLLSIILNRIIEKSKLKI